MRIMRKIVDQYVEDAVMNGANKSNVLTWIAGIVISLAVIYIMLISSFEIVAYGNIDYFQEEYEKYGVAENLNMEMEDIMYVTQEMMSYLRGERESLVVYTQVGDESREFFNDSEISHMEDVQEMFLAGISGRRICIIIVVSLFILLSVMKTKWTSILPRAFQYTTIGVVILSGIVGILFATDFYKYFELFHKIFFEGDTWLFDVNTSLMINMLPEGFFYDITLRIVLVFLSMMVALLGITIVIHKLNSSRMSK